MARRPRNTTAKAPERQVATTTLLPTPGAARQALGPSVDYMRPELTERLPEYAVIRDCLRGELALKRRDGLWGSLAPYGNAFGISGYPEGLYTSGIPYLRRYLPRPNPSDMSEDNRQRYYDYLERAVFYNVTSYTLNALVGAVFLRAAVTKLPPLLAAAEPSIGGKGISLVQLAKQTVYHVMGYGRCGLLADYSQAPDKGLSVADIASNQYRPSITLWPAWTIINWRTTEINGIEKLSLVVLVEPGIVNDDGFKETSVEQYRVLRLQNGVYTQEIWRRGGIDDTGENDSTPSVGLLIASKLTPTDHSGKPFDHIPFTFVGPSDNSYSVDKSPMLDIALLNIAHYRNSADLEENTYIAGQSTVALSGLSEDWINNVLKGVVSLGARTPLLLPEAGKAAMLQAAPNSSITEAMAAKERQMRSLGVKIVEEKRVQKTATEANYDEASAQSVLASSAANASQAVLWALQECASFTGESVGNDVLKFELNTELDLIKPSPEARKQALEEYMSRGISWTEYRHTLRRGGIATLNDDDAKADIAANPPPDAIAVAAVTAETTAAGNAKVQP